MAKFRIHLITGTLALETLLLSSAAYAGEGLFSRVYTTDTTPRGHFELEQLVRLRSGRAFGDYNALDFKTELEYGITDKLQAALYINTNRQDAHNAPDDDDPNGATGFSRHNFTLQSVSSEFIYRLVSPYSNPHGWGVALYVEPSIGFHDLHNGLTYDRQFELETRAIVQKNFHDDRLILTYNLVLEGEYIKFKDVNEDHSELDLNNEFGASYRIRPNIFMGLEGRNHNEFGDFKNWDHSLLWVGPVAHYGGRHLWATLGLLHQVAGGPGRDDAGGYIGGSRFLRSHEADEVTFKIAAPF